MAVNKSTNIEIDNETFVGNDVLNPSPCELNNSINAEDGNVIV